MFPFYLYQGEDGAIYMDTTQKTPRNFLSDVEMMLYNEVDCQLYQDERMKKRKEQEWQKNDRMIFRLFRWMFRSMQ